MDVLCFLFESEERGVAVCNNKMLTEIEFCYALGDGLEVSRDVAELLAKGVLKRREDGAIYSARIVRDEQIRKIRAKAGKRGMESRYKKLPKVCYNKKLTAPEDEDEEEVEDKDMSLRKGGAGGKPKADLFALDGLPVTFHTDQFRVAWTEWVGHRRDIRHPLTPRSVKMTFKEFAAMGPDRVIAAIQHSIANGWRGLFEPKENQSGSRNQGGDAERRRRDQRAKEFPEPNRSLPRL
jgi:hypothetical protein